MAAPKLSLLLLLAVSLLLAGVRPETAAAERRAGDSESQLRHKLQQLASKISALESWIADRTSKLKSKDEKLVLEKSASDGEIELLRTKKEKDAERMIGKAGEIEKQVNDISKEIETPSRMIEALEDRDNDMEKQVQELNLKVENDFTATHLNENGKPALDLFLQKKWILVAKEQWIMLTTHTGPYVEALTTKTIETYEICKSTITPHIIRVQEVTDPYLQEAKKFTKPRIEKIATSVKPHVEKVGITLKPYTERIYAYGQFLKSATVYHRQAFIATHWNENGKLALDLFLQKAFEKSAQVQKWAEPHLEIVKIKWIPVAKEQCIILTTHAGPYVEALSTKTIETFEICKSTITPHIFRVQELTDPYFQEAKKFTKPRIEKIATSVKPHVEKVGITLKPYTERIYASGQFLKFATVYHRQFEKKNEEQDHVIQETEDSLQEVLLGAHLAATSKSKELTEVHGTWLPPWLANLICHCQDFIATHWNENGKPALDLFFQKVQAAIHEKLEKHEFSNSLANNELVWFMASALLALPIFFLYRIISAIFCKKYRQPTRNAHVNEMPRWLRYADK